MILGDKVLEIAECRREAKRASWQDSVDPENANSLAVLIMCACAIILALL